jgi:hypothetical protein
MPAPTWTRPTLRSRMPALMWSRIW